MNNDLVNKALDQARSLQKTFGEAITKSAEAAHPLIDRAVVQAGELQGTLIESVTHATEAARPHFETALGQLTGFIALGKNALDTGVAKAYEQLDPLAEQLKKTIDATTAAMGKKPEDADPK